MQQQNIAQLREKIGGLRAQIEGLAAAGGFDRGRGSGRAPASLRPATPRKRAVLALDRNAAQLRADRGAKIGRHWRREKQIGETDWNASLSAIDHRDRRAVVRHCGPARARAFSGRSRTQEAGARPEPLLDQILLPLQAFDLGAQPPIFSRNCAMFCCCMLSRSQIDRARAPP